MASQSSTVIAAGATGHVNSPARQCINVKTYCARLMAVDFSKLCHAGFIKTADADIGWPPEQIDHFRFLDG